METKSGIQHWDPLTTVKVVDKHSYSAFPHCSEFPPFIYPVWYSFKTVFLVFQSFLVMPDKYSIRKDPGRCSLKQCFLLDPVAFLFSQMLCWICSKSQHFQSKFISGFGELLQSGSKAEAVLIAT